MTDPLYLGVDAGNSKTVAVVADGSGMVLGHGRGGCGDVYGAAGEARATAEVLAAVRGALDRAASRLGRSLGPADVAHAAFCLAGLDWPADEEYWHEQVAARLPGLTSYALRNDGFALLRAGQPDGTGVAVSAGTGAAVVGRGPAGEWSASFWIVDALGGEALGLEAFRAVVRAELGVGPTTALTAVVLTRHGHPDVARMLQASTHRGAPRRRHAGLARDVLDAARAGDDVAAGIVADQARRLAGYTAATARRVGLTGSFAVVLGGSVLGSTNPALREALAAALAEQLPAARAVPSPCSPVVGAVAEAIAEGEGGLGADVVARLTRTRFPDEFLLT